MKVKPTSLGLPVYLVVAATFAQSALVQAQAIQFNRAYVCEKERIVVFRCRKDSDMPGFPPTRPEEDYCHVEYPDRPLRGGFTQFATVLRSDVIKQLTSCGAFAQAEKEALANATIPSTADGNYELGNRQMKAKLYEEAIASFKRSIAIIPMSAAYNDMAQCYAKLDHYPEAIAAMKQAIAIKPDNMTARLNLGLLYSDAGQHENAVTALADYLKRQPADGEAYYHLGYSYFKLNRRPEALAATREAVRLEPRNGKYLFNLGSLLSMVGQKDEALKVYDTLKLIDAPKANELLKELMKIPTATSSSTTTATKPAAPKPAATVTNGTNGGQPQQTVSPNLVQQAANYRVSMEKADLCASLYEADKFSEAIAACNESLRLNPKNALAWRNLALSSGALDKWADAENAWNQYFLNADKKTDVTEALIDYGDAKLNLKKYDAAIKVYQYGLNRKPKNDIASQFYDRIGYTYYKMDQYDKAEAPLLTAIKIDPLNVDARCDLGKVYILMNRYEEAVAELKEAVNVERTNAQAHFYLGIAYVDLKRKADATREYNILTKLDPERAAKLKNLILQMK